MGLAHCIVVTLGLKSLQITLMSAWTKWKIIKAKKCYVKVCSLLLSHGADPTLLNCHSKSAIDVAPNRELQVPKLLFSNKVFVKHWFPLRRGWEGSSRDIACWTVADKEIHKGSKSSLLLRCFLTSHTTIYGQLVCLGASGFYIEFRW